MREDDGRETAPTPRIYGRATLERCRDASSQRARVDADRDDIGGERWKSATQATRTRGLQTRQMRVFVSPYNQYVVVEPVQPVRDHGARTTSTWS